MIYGSIPLVFFLVFGFILAIVLQAWFVRRLSYLRGKTKENKDHYDRLHQEAVSLTEAVTEFDRGIDSSKISVQVLEREIEELEQKIAGFEAVHGVAEEAHAAGEQPDHEQES